MHSTTATALDRVLFALGFALLIALAWPGIRVNAEEPRDIAPSARDLTGLRSRPLAAPVAANTAPGCEAQDPSIVAAQYAQRQQQMRDAARAMGGGGTLKPMNGRGYAYAQPSDPALDLLRLQMEARALDRKDAAQ